MAEYFKFCPKCGRVLDRDWCPHCEPEKERKFRKNQLKRDQDMFEAYSKDAPRRKLFSKSSEDVKTPSKTITQAKVRKSKKESRKDGKGMKAVLSTIAVGLVIVIPILFDLAGEMSVNPFDELDISSMIEEHIPFLEEKITVSENGFTGIEIVDTDEDYAYSIELNRVPEEELGPYRVNGSEYEYSVYRPVIHGPLGQEGGEAQEEMDKVFQQWYQEGLEAKKEKLPVNGYLFAYTTYLDESTACVVFNGSRYSEGEDSRSEEYLYSFFIDLDTMTTYDPLYGEVPDESLYEEIEERLETSDFTREDFREMLQNGEYCIIADNTGRLWLGMVMNDGYEQIMNIKLEERL